MMNSRINRMMIEPHLLKRDVTKYHDRCRNPLMATVMRAEIGWRHYVPGFVCPGKWLIFEVDGRKRLADEFD